jgi:hypothetical protein
MDVGETVVLLSDVDGMPAGKEGVVMKVRDDILLIRIRSAERQEEFVLAKCWEVLPARTVETASCLLIEEAKQWIADPRGITRWREEDIVRREAQNCD